MALLQLSEVNSNAAIYCKNETKSKNYSKFLHYIYHHNIYNVTF